MATATAAPPAAIDLSDARLIAWAKGIARGIRGVIRQSIVNTAEGDTRRCSRFDRGSDEEQELEQVALTEMASVAIGLDRHDRPRFDPGRMPTGGDLTGYFKGRAHKAIKFAVLKAARRLSNGGLGRQPVRVSHLSALESGDDEDPVEIADPRSVRPPTLPPADPGRLDAVTPADLTDLAGDNRPTLAPVPLVAVDVHIQILSAGLQAAVPASVPAAYAASYARVIRAELVAAEEARDCLGRLLAIAGRYADLGLAIGSALAAAPCLRGV